MSSEAGQQTANVTVKASGDVKVGAITFNNYKYINFIGFNSENCIREIVEDHDLTGEILKLLVWDQSNEIGQYSKGAFRQAIENIGSCVPTEKFEIIDKKFAGGLSHAKFENQIGQKQAFACSSELVSLGRRSKIYSEAEVNRWGIDAGFANQIAELAYNDDNLQSIRAKKGINDGTLAVADSINYYVNGDLVNLQDNTLRLLMAFDCSNSDYSRGLILNRLIVNANLLSDFSIVENYVSDIAFDEIQDKNIAAKLLDAYATLSFNKISAESFVNFDGVDLTKIINAWNRRGVIISDASLDRDYIDEFGLHIFTIQQIRHFDLCNKLSKKSNSFNELRELRKQMVEDFLNAVRIAAEFDQEQNIAKDFFGSLQRPAFHALLCQDLDHLTEIMDIYFGRNGRGSSATLDKARKEILNTRGRNRQWMSLLDITQKLFYNKHEAGICFDKFIRSYRITSSNPLVKNQVVLKTLPHIAQAIGYSGAVLDEESSAITSSRLSKQTLHQAYGHGIVRALGARV